MSDTEEMTAERLGRVLADATAEAFTAYTTQAQQARDDLYALTMSGLGGCTRQAAYRVARTPPSQELVFREMREANIGTMIHEGLLPHMAVLLGGREEVPVEMTVGDLTIKGRTDLYVEPLRTVADLKTVGQFKFAGLGGDVNRSHRLQVGGYAYAVVQSGLKVEWIAWVYVDRSSGAEHVVVEPFTDELIELVEQRCADLTLYAQDPEAAPRDERGPGLSYVCDSCPWLKTCWGADAEPGAVGAQRILAQDHAGVARALALYDSARAREKEAADEKEFAKAMFASYEPGNYGEFTFAWSSAGESTDKDAAVELLASAGIPVPRKRTTRRLVVRRSK
jgi:hypothetical protein